MLHETKVPRPVDTGRTPRRVVAGLVSAVLVAALVLAAPDVEGLPPEGRRMGAIFVMAVILWATEAIPVAVTALLALILQPIFGTATLQAAFAEFMSPVFFFVLAMFCLAIAVINSGLDRRFAHWLLRRAGTSSRRIVVALMVGTAATSAIMSDVPACAMFMTVALGILARAGVRPGSNFGRAAMIGIPIAALIGGVATPAGSSINILGIHFIEDYGQVRVPFVEWMIIGIPMVIVLVPIACWTTLRCFPPEIDTVPMPATDGRSGVGRTTLAERKIIGLLLTMVVLWIVSSWQPQLDVVLIALTGAIVMFLPGVRLLSWQDAERGVAWETLLMIGGVTSLGAASVSTGLAGWLVDALLGGMEAWSLPSVLATIGVFTVVVHLALPIGPVVNAVVVPPIALLASASGVNPALYALPVAFTASCAFLLPLDAVSLITYSKGYYHMVDMLLPGAIVSLAWVIWMTMLMMALRPVLDFV